MFFSKRKEERSKREDVTQKVLTIQLNTEINKEEEPDNNSHDVIIKEGETNMTRKNLTRKNLTVSEFVEVLQANDINLIKTTFSNMRMYENDIIDALGIANPSFEVLDYVGEHLSTDNIKYHRYPVTVLNIRGGAVRLYILCKACEDGNIEMFEKYKTYDYLSIDGNCYKKPTWFYPTPTTSNIVAPCPYFDDGGEINYRCIGLKTPIFLAIKNGHVDIISRIFDYIGFDKINNKFIMSSNDELHDGILASMLTYASEHNQLYTIQYFTELLGVNIYKHGTFAGIAAIMNANTNILDYLINHGLNTDAIFSSKRNYCLSKDHIDTYPMVEYLLVNNLYPKVWADASLIWIVEHNDLDSLKALRENYDLDIHYNNEEALKCASTKGFFDIVKYLVENGADIQVDDMAPMRWAGFYGHLEVVKYLVEHGSNIRACGDFVLNTARQHNHNDMIQYINSIEK